MEYVVQFSDDTYEECVIKNIRGVQNDVVAREIVSQCLKYPERKVLYSGSGIFGSRTAQNCVLKNGADIRSPLGARALAGSCYRTYPKE